MVDHWEPVLGHLETFMTRFDTPATLGQSKIINFQTGAKQAKQT